MKIKMSGFDEFERSLKKFQKNAKELSETEQIPFDQLFTTSFMSKYTEFSSFDELLERGGFVVNSQEDFEKISDDIFDEHVSSHTRFNKWEDMLAKATEEYIAKQLGF